MSLCGEHTRLQEKFILHWKYDLFTSPEHVSPDSFISYDDHHVIAYANMETILRLVHLRAIKLQLNFVVHSILLIQWG